MADMSEDDLLNYLQRLEQDSASFANSVLGAERATALAEYFREPYGTEEEGWSMVVTSDVQDTVEWILPDLLDIFTSTDEAVQFDPQGAEDVAGAQQATDTCNYIFYRQNNGFVTLYTAFKDALLSKNCAVMWRKVTERVKTIIPVRNATPEMLTLALHEAGDDAEIESAELAPPPQPSPSPQIARPALPAPSGGGPAMPPGAPSGGPPGPNGARGFAPNMAPGGVQPMGGLPPQGPPPGAMPGGPPMARQGPPPMQGAGMPPGGPPMARSPVAQGIAVSPPQGMPPMDGPPMGMPAPMMPTAPPEPPPILFNARIAKYTQKTTIRVEAFSPDDLLIQRDWTSPLLDDCAYVAREMEVTLSDLQQMGFDDVDAGELAASDDAATMGDAAYYSRRRGVDLSNANALVDADEESQTRGWLRIEYVLVDFDGDGISERREVMRLKDRILSNEEAWQVPIATASPVLVPHRWDGLSIAEMVSDIQQVKTELTRQILNNAYLANNPRKKVLTDVNWSPLANIDDLLDGRPGGVLRQRQVDAITVDQTPWIGGNMFPLLEYIDNMREQRTGASRQQQGLDPNALRPDRTATEIQMTATAARQRIRLIARILAECLMKPIFAGLLKLLTDGNQMQPIAFRLRGAFVQYDPNEWRDHYDMTINVGLGTGDRQQQAAMLQQMLNNQMMCAQSPYGQLLITPQNIYATQAKLTETAGFKDIDTYWTNPQGQPLPKMPPPPDPMVQVAQIKAQSDAQATQFKAQADQQTQQLRAQHDAQLAAMQADHDARLEGLRITGQNENAKAQLALQATNDQRDAQREAMKASYQQQADDQDRQMEMWKANLEADTKKQIAAMQAQVQQQIAILNAQTQTKTAEDRNAAMAKRPKPNGGGGAGAAP